MKGVTSRTVWLNTLLGVAVLATAVAVDAETGSRPYREHVTGTFSSSTLDRNGDGVPANLSVFSGTSSLGDVHGSSSFEVTAFGPPVNCQVDELEAALVGTRDVRRFPERGDMVFLEVSDLLLCLNPATGAFRLSSRGHFIGGTGRHSRATGGFTGSFAGVVLAVDPNGALFGAFSGGIRGTIDNQ
jgi:hypothetical protein